MLVEHLWIACFVVVWGGGRNNTQHRWQADDQKVGGKRARDKVDGVWGAVKEGEGSNVAVDGKDFGEEVDGVDEAGKEDKTEE